MSKNYVTIKIPEATRDKAQEDSRTYEEIMQAGLGENERPQKDDIIIKSVEMSSDGTITREGLEKIVEEVEQRYEDLRQRQPYTDH